MKTTSRLLLSAIVASACFTPAMAQDATPVTINVDKADGSLYRGGTAQSAAGTWCSEWISTATNPGVKLSAPVNNMQWSGDNLDLRSGSAGSSVYTITSTSSGYSFTFTAIDSANPETITAGEKNFTSSATAQTLTVADIEESNNTKFTVEGANKGILVTNFTVTLSPRAEVKALFQTTTITDGEFAPETNWYTIQIAEAGYHWTYVPGATKMSLSQTKTEFADADLWCFTGDEDKGFQIYNKAAGAGMMFAAPTTMTGTTGATAYAVVKEPGATGYCYDWQFRETDVLGEDIPAFYVNELGATAKVLNNRDNTLAFWTGGADAGSAVQVIWAQQTVDFDAANNGEFAIAPGTSSSAWSASWTHNLSQVGFQTSANNMQPAADHLKIYTGIQTAPWTFFSPEGTYVCGYEFDFCKDGSYDAVVTVANGDDNAIDATAENQHFAVTNLSESASSDLNITANPANANKGIRVTNFSITYRRTTEPMLGTIVFRYDGTPGYNVCYRIPSITTIENGPHKGRLLAINDYRYSGADIGNGRIDLYMSYSDDNGLTWSEPDHMRDANGNPVAQGTGLGTLETSLQHPDCGFGDPAMVSDRETGRILVVSVCGRTPFWSGRRNNPNQVARWYSEDGGETWSKYTNITEDIYTLFDGTTPNGYIDSQFFGSGRMVQSRYIKVGDYYRVYAVMSGYHNASGNVSNWVLYTDDLGQTWHILGDPMTPPVPSLGDEPKAEELPDGSVLLAARRNSGNRHFNVFHYTDIESAEGTWGTAVATNMGMGNINACNGEIMILPVRNVETQEPAYMALQSFPYGGSRRNVSIAWKVLDEAADIATPEAFTTWNGRIQISKMGSCYSTMCWQHDNTLGFLYEEETLGKSYCEVYRNLSIEDITDGKYEYAPDENGEFAAKLTKEVVSYRLENEAPNGTPGEFVGQPDGEGNVEAEEAAAEYLENPTLENYLLFNKAITSGGGVIRIQDGGVYVIKSAHNGKYTFGDRWLTSDGSKLMSVSAPTEETMFTIAHRNEESANWVLYHPATKTYLAQSPSTLETSFTVTTDPAMAHDYAIASSLEGYTTFCDSDPGHATYNAIHQGGNNNGHIVIWLASEQPSKWYVSFDHMATEDEMPDFTTIGITEINAGDEAPVRYFDVTGRQVAVPVRGQLLITSDRRKVIF